MRAKASWAACLWVCLFFLEFYLPLAAQVPGAIDVAPSGFWDGHDGPWSSFEFQLGPSDSLQRIRVFPSFTAGNLYPLGDPGCPQDNSAESSQRGNLPLCDDSRGGTFVSNHSSDWTPIGSFTWGQSSSAPHVEVNGTLGTETVWITLDNKTTNVGMQVVNVLSGDWHPWVGFFGISPLSTNVVNASISQSTTTLFDNLWSGRTKGGNSFSYTAGAYYRNFTASLVIGGTDTSRFDASTSVQFGMRPDPSTSLLVVMKNISTDANLASQPAVIVSGAPQAWIEPTYPYLYLDRETCSLFASAFNLTWDAPSELYFIEDDVHERLTVLRPNITFTLCSWSGFTKDYSPCADYVFPYAAFAKNASVPLIIDADGKVVTNGTSKRYFPIQPTNESVGTLGRTFLQETHIFADYDRSVFNLSQGVFGRTAQSNIVAVRAPDSDSGSGLNAADIAGIVVAMVAVLAPIGYLVLAKIRNWWPFKSKAGTRVEEQGKPELDGTATPWMEISGKERSELPGAERPNEMPDVKERGDVELVGSIPLYELPAATEHKS
ncbi:aspartic peptidase domain-containing protein [Phyllosticta capitalensis]|uniref:Aspartic peptidase domain-containing protein n=1 Tax=Phyllosticta capitalensis TaxID=121624 RepID=A0ABR1YH40_9PEZI